jgi:hypothetical protein
MPISSRTLAGVVAILMVVFSADGAEAQPVAETLARWGLIGTWSTDCNRPPTRTNYRVSYVARAGGRVFHERDFGNRRDSREIRAATVGPGGWIEVVADFGALGGMRKWTMMKGVDGRIRTVANSKLDGTDATIRGGRFVVGGDAETVWQMRCPASLKGLREVRAHCTVMLPGMRCLPRLPLASQLSKGV